MPELLKGTAAVVTGSSRGIGRAIALAFAEQGADLVIHGTNVDLLAELQDQIRKKGVRCEYIAGNIGEYATSEKLVEACLGAYQRIDTLVNNAGINSRYSFDELTIEEWDRMIRINLTGAFYACKCAIPHMQEKKRGCIVNISSLAAKTAHPNASVCYGVSKAGVNALTQKLAYDMAPHGIRVNAVCPGPVETDMSKQWTPEYRRKVSGAVPLGRLGSTADIANVAVFLASDMSSFIVGESINVNGGKYMN